MTDSESTILATDCFISYRHVDNDAFGNVVDRIKNELEQMYTAHTGKTLRIFLDRTSIGWGADWRQQIRESVEQATALIPVVTMRYFSSSACCDELMAFHSNAEQLGVPELILPIVIAGSDQISSDDPRAEVQLIERLNYKNLEQAWLAGYDSPEWRRAMFDVVRSLDSALTAAEDRLTVREQESVQTDTGLTTDSTTPAPVEGDVTEFTTRLEGLGGSVERTLALANSFMSKIGESLNAGDVQSLSSSQRQNRLIRLAGEIAPVAKTLGIEASALLAEARDLDALLRAINDEMSELSLPGMTELQKKIASSFQVTHDAEQVEQQMDQVISGAKAFGLLNVSLRRAIAPGIQGLESMQSAVRIFISWQHIATPKT